MIADNTAILPELIADSVVREAETLLGRVLPEGAAVYLVDRAEQHYAANERFRSGIHGRGNTGRDSLYMWFRHWLAGWVLSHVGTRLPAQFCNGIGAA